MVSVATALIPFLEHDDANRALMGANMQRQAVPLLRSEAPLVGTGMERRVAVDAGGVIVADAPGTVEDVTADQITVRHADGSAKVYRMRKFERSNQGTCINQKPIVVEGAKIAAGDVLADGPCTDTGELALGKNLLVAFMPWEGHNYEDAIILSERLVKDDVLTSIHIEEHEVDARDTKLGAEEITRDIPNVSEDVLKDLDERGIIRIGAEVDPGDDLVGKVTPKGETELTPEERLLRAIFGEKAREVRDTSLKVPHGETGKVIGVQGVLPRGRRRPPPGRERAGPGLRRPEAEDLRGRQAGRPPRQQGRHLQDPPRGGHALPGRRHPGRHHPLPARRAEPDEPRPGARDPPRLGGRPRLVVRRPARLGQGDRLDQGAGPPGRDAAVGPRCSTAPRRGGHRGPAQATLEHATTTRRRRAHKLVDAEGKAMLFDGRTGEPYDDPGHRRLHLHHEAVHLVDDKIHARSTGPYSMITQQPLGGKAQFGGQRFGEMEVWALEAYGAAYALQELLTIKSDDVQGRVKVYEAIVKGDNIPEPGIPESFKVLIKEMQCLCLNVEMLSAEVRRSSCGSSTRSVPQPRGAWDRPQPARAARVETMGQMTERRRRCEGGFG